MLHQLLNYGKILCIVFAFIVSFILYLPLGGNVWRGDLPRDFCVTILGLKFGGAYTQKGLFSELNSMYKKNYKLICMSFESSICEEYAVNHNSSLQIVAKETSLTM